MSPSNKYQTKNIKPKYGFPIMSELGVKKGMLSSLLRGFSVDAFGKYS